MVSVARRGSSVWNEKPGRARRQERPRHVDEGERKGALSDVTVTVSTKTSLCCRHSFLASGRLPSLLLYNSDSAEISEREDTISVHSQR